jgi:hypothetical protein
MNKDTHNETSDKREEGVIASTPGGFVMKHNDSNGTVEISFPWPTGTFTNEEIKEILRQVFAQEAQTDCEDGTATASG